MMRSWFCRLRFCENWVGVRRGFVQKRVLNSILVWMLLLQISGGKLDAKKVRIILSVHRCWILRRLGFSMLDSWRGWIILIFTVLVFLSSVMLVSSLVILIASGLLISVSTVALMVPIVSSVPVAVLSIAMLVVSVPVSVVPSICSVSVSLVTSSH